MKNRLSTSPAFRRSRNRNAGIHGVKPWIGVFVACLTAVVLAPAAANAAISTTLSVTPSTTQAAAHPNTAVTITPTGDKIRDVTLDLAPGIVANPESVSVKCTAAQFNADTCAGSTIVGSASTTAKGCILFICQSPESPGTIYVLVPDATDAATLGIVSRPAPVLGTAQPKVFMKIHVTVRPLDGGLHNVITGIPNTSGSMAITVTKLVTTFNSRAGTSTTSGPFFFVNPHSCALATSTVTVTSYNNTTGSASSAFTPTGCPSVPFSGTANIQPVNKTAGAPTGINATLTFPTADQTIQSSDMKSTVVTFPNGTGIDFPAIAAVSALCTEAQVNTDTCPAGSDIGNASADSPFLPPMMTGDIYLTGRSSQVQFGVVLRGARGTKVIIKGSSYAVDIDGDGMSDAVRAFFVGVPQQPVTSTTMNFVTQMLDNPATCGAQNITAVLNAHSGAQVTTNSSYTTTSSDPNCPAPTPNTTLTAGAAPSSNDSTPTFSFTSDQPGSTFACSIDAAAPTACTSPYTSAPLADGTHTFEVAATAAGQTDPTPASQSFTIDATPPSLTISSPAEGATITAGISVPVSFTAEAGSATACKTDAGAAAACTSPYTTAPLANGAHSVTVAATDAAGNTSTVVRNFTLNVADSTPPDTTITGGPTGTVNTDVATFAFTSTEAGSTFKCKNELGSTAGTAAFGNCSGSGTHTVSGVASGTYTFSVRATDAAGNVDPSPATRTYTLNVPAGSVIYKLTARNSGMVADIAGSSTALGAIAVQSASTGILSQQWKFAPTGDACCSRIVNRNSGLCLTVKSSSQSNGAVVDQEACSSGAGSGTNQQWYTRTVATSYIQIVARHSDRCLIVNGASTTAGAALVQYTCSSSATNQQWTRTTG